MRCAHEWKALPGQRVAHDVFHAGFHLAFRLRPMRRAGPRAYAVVATEVGVDRMKHNRLARVRQHHRFRIVDDDRIGDATEMLKRLFMPTEPVTNPLPTKRGGETAAREAERHHEDLHDRVYVRDPHTRLAEVASAAVRIFISAPESYEQRRYPQDVAPHARQRSGER